MKTNPNVSVDPKVQNLLDFFNSSKSTDNKPLTTNFGPKSVLPQYIHPNVTEEEFGPYFPQRFFKYTPGLTEEHRARNQGSFEQLGRSATKFVGKTALNVAGGIGGTVYGGLNALINQDFEKLYNNDVINTLDEMKQELDKSMPVYKTKEFEQAGFGKRLFQHPAQLTDDVSDALAFTAGAVITGLVTAGIGDALIPASAIRAFSMLDKAAKAGRVVQGMNKLAVLKGVYDTGKLASQLFFGANYESIVETKQSMDALRKNLELQGVPESQIEETINQAEKFSYFANLGVVGLSNMAQFPKIFNPFYGKSLLKLADIGIDTAGKAFAKYTQKSLLGKALSTTGTILKRPAEEGLFEEGLQRVISETSQDYWSRINDPEAQNTIQEFLNSFIQNAKETYDPTNKEAWNEIGMGMLVGGLGSPGRGAIPGKFGKIDGQRAPIWQGGIYESFKERSNQRQTTDDLVTELNKNPDILPIVKAQYESLIRDASIQKDLDRALEIDDKFSWKNLQHDQVFNWIRSRVKAGLGDVAKNQIEAMRELTPEQFSKEIYGEKSELQITKQEQDKLIDHLIQKTDDIVKATNKIDQVYRSSEENKEKDPVRETLIHSITGLQDLDQRESEIYKSIQDLTKGFLNEEILRDKSAPSYKRWLTDTKERLKDPNISKEEKEELEPMVKLVEEAVKEKVVSEKINKQELLALNKWLQNDATGYTINRKEVFQMLEDTKKIRERRQNLIDQYNVLFTKEGQAKFKQKTSEPPKKPIKSSENINPEEIKTFIAKQLVTDPNTRFKLDGNVGTITIVDGKVILNTGKKKITIEDKNLERLEILESKETKEETPEITEAQKVETEIKARLNSFAIVLKQNYNRFFALNTELKKLDELINETHTKARATAQKLKFQKSTKLSDELIQETEELLEQYRTQLNSYQQQRDLLREQMDSLEENIEFIEDFIKEMKSKKTIQEFRTPLEQANDVLKQAKQSTDELKQGINLTKDLITNITTKIKQLREYIKQLEKTLADHKAFQLFINDFITHTDEFVKTVNLTGGLTYDLGTLMKYLEWRKDYSSETWYPDTLAKNIYDVIKDLNEAKVLQPVVDAAIKSLESQEFEGQDKRSSIPMNQYLLEILESQLANQQKNLQEQQDKLNLQEQAQRIYDLYNNALPAFQKLNIVPVSKKYPKLTGPDDLTKDQTSPIPDVNPRQRQQEPRKINEVSSANQPFETKPTEKGRETQFYEKGHPLEGQPIVDKLKEGTKEHRWALFLDKLDSIQGYSVKLQVPEQNSNLLSAEQINTEELWENILNDTSIQLTDNLIDTDAVNIVKIENSKYFQKYSDPEINTYDVKSALYHVQQLNDRLKLLQLLGITYQLGKERSPIINSLLKGIAITLHKDSKQIFLDSDGNPTETNEVPATALLMAPTAVLKPIYKDNKLVDVDSDLAIPKEVRKKGLEAKLAFLKPKAMELLTLRARILNAQEPVDAEIEDLSAGIPIFTEFKPLTASQKEGAQLTVATGEYSSITSGTGKSKKTYRFPTTPGLIYSINKDKATYVVPNTHGVNPERVTNIIDLISYLYKQSLSKVKKPTEITIQDDKGNPLYLLNFAQKGNMQGLLSDLLFWGPNGNYSHKIYIDFKTKSLVLQEKSDDAPVSIPLADLNIPGSANYKIVEAFISNKYFNVNKNRLQDSKDDFYPDFTITKDKNLDNWTISGTPVNYHDWMLSNGVGTNRPEAKGQQFSAVSHYISIANPKFPEVKDKKKKTVKKETKPKSDIEAKKADVEKLVLSRFGIATKKVVKSKGPSNGKTIIRSIKTERTSDGEILKITPHNTFEETGETLVTTSVSMSLAEFKEAYYPLMTEREIELFEATLGDNVTSIQLKEIRIGLRNNHLKGQINIDVHIVDDLGIHEGGVTLNRKLNDAELAALKGNKEETKPKKEKKTKKSKETVEPKTLNVGGYDFQITETKENTWEVSDGSTTKTIENHSLKQIKNKIKEATLRITDGEENITPVGNETQLEAVLRICKL